MTQFRSPKPSEFDPLRSFLQANAPQAPVPNPELETQLMQAIDALPLDPVAEGRPTRSRVYGELSKRWWIFSAAIVTSVGLLWMGRSWQVAQRSVPVPNSDSELLALQDFLEDTWGVVGYVDTTETWSNPDWMPLSRTDPL